jgi:DNA-binding NtrC family response regulator
MDKKAKILVIDDEEDMLSGCRKILEAHGHSPVTVSNGKRALQILSSEDFDIILCDLLMPEVDGMQILDHVQKNYPATPVVIFSAYGTIDRAVSAMKAGAFDFIEKPFDTQHVNLVIEKALRQRNLFKERNNLIEQLQDKYGFDNIVGKSPAMKEVFDLIKDVSKSDANILITGESGTGKELIARSIHAHSQRKAKPFVPVNCGAFPENLFEAELFGYEKGAFTGASQRKIGLLEYSDEGTFFLDEVCELQTTLQAKLLRTLQDRQLRRVGGNELIQIDIRLISATNRDLKKALSSGDLREDFYYRLNVINIHLPPLRERKSDIRLLAEHFLEISRSPSANKLKGFTEEVLNIFESYDWPGNVRELENVVERAITLAKSDQITQSELPSEITLKEIKKVPFERLKLSDAKQKVINDLEKDYLLYLLKKFNGNVTKMAVDAGMTRRNVHRLLNQHELDPAKWRI